MSTTHTKGRLTVRGRYSVCTEDGETEVANTRWTTLDSSNDEDNARRLVDCWNFCDEVSDKDLDDRLPLKELLRRYNTALQQNAELLKALKDLERVSGLAMTSDDPSRVEARAAIAKAEGGAA